MDENAKSKLTLAVTRAHAKYAIAGSLIKQCPRIYVLSTHLRPSETYSTNTQQKRQGKSPFLTVEVFPLKQVIYDVDDGNALMRPEEGVPHADMLSLGHESLCRFSSDPSSIAHNPYGCFGAPGVAWPRGYPLSEIHQPNSSTCELEERRGAAGPRIGVVQALANHDPDVDAIYRLTHRRGGLPFDFTAASSGAPECPVRGVPADAMTPYNAQVSSPLTSHRRTG